jgi:Integrase core domain
VLCCIQLLTRRVYLAGVTANPTGAWVAQQARNLPATLDDDATAVRFLLRDRDRKFTRAFDDHWRAAGAEVIRTPIQAPNANAVAERWVGTVRRECLDHLLIAGRRQLLRSLHHDVEHYNRHRPHRSLDLSAPEPSECWEEADRSAAAWQLHRRDVLGGLIHEYEPAPQYDRRPTTGTPRVAASLAAVKAEAERRASIRPTQLAQRHGVGQSTAPPRTGTGGSAAEVATTSWLEAMGPSWPASSVDLGSAVSRSPPGQPLVVRMMKVWLAARRWS